MPIAYGASSGALNVIKQQEEEKQRQEEIKYKYDLMQAMYGRQKPLDISDVAAGGKVLRKVIKDDKGNKSYAPADFGDLIKIQKSPSPAETAGQLGYEFIDPNRSNEDFKMFLSSQDLQKDLLLKATNATEQEVLARNNMVKQAQANPFMFQMSNQPIPQPYSQDEIKDMIQSKYWLLKKTYGTNAPKAPSAPGKKSKPGIQW